MAYRSIAQIAQDLRARRVSAQELAEQAIAAAKAHVDLNAFITLDEGAASRATAASDSMLAGIPFAHKDIFCTNGQRTTCASRIFMQAFLVGTHFSASALSTKGVCRLKNGRMSR